jgi:hypothetical protein
VRTRSYPVVILGNGGSVSNAPTRVAEIVARYRAGGVRYFGDLDFDGLRIAVDLSKVLAERSVACRPLADAYARLARYSRPVPADNDKRDSLPARRGEIAAWLGNDIVMAAQKPRILPEATSRRNGLDVTCFVRPPHWSTFRRRRASRIDTPWCPFDCAKQRRWST